MPHCLEKNQHLCYPQNHLKVKSFSIISRKTFDFILSHLRDIIFLQVNRITHEGVIMAVSYKRRFHLLIEKDMTTANFSSKPDSPQISSHK